MGEPEWAAVREVIESGWVTQGPRVAEFEKATAELCGAQHGVAVSSCTAALHLALVCAGVGAGDEVVVPSMSFVATANAVVHSGATPVFAEVDPETFNLDVADVERRLGPRTRAVLVVHQLGLPADIDAFHDLAADRDLVVIEDAACAIGSRYKGMPIGSHSRIVCFSFHPRKVVSTGDGGMLLVQQAEDADRLRRLRQHGMSVPDLARHESTTHVKESYDEVGYNYRLTDIQAAVGIEQLRRLPEILTRRREVASWYDAALGGSDLIGTPVVPGHVEWNVQSYAVRLSGFDAPRRDRVIDALLTEGIASRPGVMTSHREPAYARAGASLPISENASDSSLILPLYPQMTPAEVEQVSAVLVGATRAAAS